MGPNFFIWIAMIVVVASTIAGLYGHYWVMGLGFATAVMLGLFNKLRAIRRRRDEMGRKFD